MLTKSWSAKDLEKKWGRKLPPDVQRSLPWDVLSVLASGLSDDTKIPRDVLNECIRTRDVSGLFQVADSLDATAYASADLLLQDRLVGELFSKFDFFDSPFNKREKAKLRFFEAEERCREANLRVVHGQKDLSTDQNAVLHSAIRLIEQRILRGKFEVDEILDFARFGPGATLCVKGPFTTEYFKLSEKCPTVSSDAFPYAEALLAHDDKWRAYLQGIHPFDVWGRYTPVKEQAPELGLVDYNKVAFVPKNAKTERSIAIEPYFNVYFQLGIGGMLRKRLYKHCNINLDSQLRNQALAHKGSITGELATIDFSMASDTISRETVRLLLPSEWFDHLDRLRSKNYLMDGVIRPWQKFSSMGNGYTFELETLIFYAIAESACRHLGLDSSDVTVFGDDVVLPTEACALFQSVCVFLGFKVNEEKSYLSGPFRESCGEDYLKGIRVRPVFCKELATVQHVASLANRLSALDRAVGGGSRLDDMLRRAVDLLHRHIPRDVRRLVVGPPSEDSDGYVHTTELATLAGSELVRWNRDLYCWEHPTIRFRPKKLTRRDDAAALWIGFGTSVRKKPIPKQLAIVEGLTSIAGGRFRYLSDFVAEPVPRTITGREIGKLSLPQIVVLMRFGGCSTTRRSVSCVVPKGDCSR
jgi:hypothetical protein